MDLIEDDERAQALGAGQGADPGEPIIAASVHLALAAYLGGRKAADKDPPFQLLVRGKAGARFPTSEEFTQVEEDEDQGPWAIPKVKRRATP